MIHSENPFLPGPEDRQPSRRLRGRLAAGVCIVTAGSIDDPTGLTVSSLMVVEGDPSIVSMVVGPSTDLWDVAETTGRFVVHVCRFEDLRMAEVFAGVRPSPGGPFASVAWEQSDWGPLLTDLGDRAYCVLDSREETGYSGIMTGAIDHVDLTDLRSPLIHFRGRYHRLD